MINVNYKMNYFFYDRLC